MIIDDALLTRSEKLVYSLKSLYAAHGYLPYRMSRFEEYDFYASNKDFLVSDQVLTFTDTNGKLMALKPDVTLSIINNVSYDSSEIKKIYYNENVYRSDKNSGSFREILQTGLECFGAISDSDITEVILLAEKSLSQVSEDSMLMLSNLTILEGILKDTVYSSSARKEFFRAVRERNLNQIETLCRQYDVPDIRSDLLEALLACHGSLHQIEDKIRNLLDRLDFIPEAEAFVSILSELSRSEAAEKIGIDFSITDDVNYYNGIIFKGYVNGLPEAVLSGGQYDRLMEKMLRKARAIGFAVYTGTVEEAYRLREDRKDGYINIALPKGRLGERVYAMFARAGYECPEILEENRKLVFENPERMVRYFWVKPADTVIYVERGVADVSVVGKDILAEDNSDVYELLDLKTGICQMAVAAPVGYEEDPEHTLKVATKFPNIARRYYHSQGRDIDIIKLNGSIEIAPLLGLSDVIVDIVETGRTLKENNLEVRENIMPISARLIANHSAYAFKAERIKEMQESMAEAVRKENDQNT